MSVDAIDRANLREFGVAPGHFLLDFGSAIS